MRHNVPVLKLNDGTLVVETDHFHDVSDAIPVKEEGKKQRPRKKRQVRFLFFSLFDLLFDKGPVAQKVTLKTSAR